MNMYGILTPDVQDERARPPLVRRFGEYLVAKRFFLLLVVLPIALVGGYYALIASDQYVSDSHFLVRNPASPQQSTSGLGQFIGAAAGIQTSAADAGSVADYLTSHDAVAALEKRVDLLKLFQRPEADWISRLRGSDPTPERMLRYYLGHIKVTVNQESGITTLSVHAFRPEDALKINSALLQIGEERVNQMNLRSYDDSLKMARKQLVDAEQAVGGVQGRITRYRQSGHDIDPQVTGESQIRMVSTLQSQLAAARSQLQAMGTLISRSSPQYVALAARVRSLQSEIGTESAKLAGGSSTIAVNLGGYEDLKVRQEFAGKQYDAAAANLAKAREDAMRQQLYVVRTVEPNLPVKSTYPHSWKIVITLTIALLLAYAIGWLIVAGVKEHAA